MRALFANGTELPEDSPVTPGVYLVAAGLADPAAPLTPAQAHRDTIGQAPPAGPKREEMRRLEGRHLQAGAEADVRLVQLGCPPSSPSGHTFRRVDRTGGRGGRSAPTG